MTDQQLDDLERLLRERDEARATFQTLLDRAKASGESIAFGETSKEYDRLAKECMRAVWAFDASAIRDAPALVAEVRRLRAELGRVRAALTTPVEEDPEAAAFEIEEGDR